MPARNLVWILVVATIALLLWNGPDVIARRETVYELFSPLVDVRAEIHKRYVEEVDDKALMRGAIEGMLHSLDPFSTYLNPDDYPRFKQHTAGRFGGIGIEVGLKNGVLTVITPMENTPAFKAGLLADDRILEIDGEPADHITMADAVQKLMGSPGSQVTLKVCHALKDQVETISITRAEIEVASVWGWQRDADNGWDYWVDAENRIAYVRVSGFLDNTPASFNQVMQKIMDSGPKALVLDLRFNPGGSLPAAVSVADRFLDSGTIVSVRGRWRAEEIYKASKENTLPEMPMVVLVNDQTASGAEIVSGALRDHERAVVIGKRTYGKGSVQEVIELGNGNSAIKMTTAYYYLPDGELIHRTPAARQSGKWGVEPNITVELTNEETQQIVEARMAADRAFAPSSRPGASAPARPVVDRQLAKGLEVLREKLNRPASTDKVAASQSNSLKARTAS